MAKINPSREGILGTEKERARIMVYVNPNSEDVRQMEEAYKVNDFDSMREVFSRYNSGFIGNIFEVYDVDIKMKFAQSFLEKYSSDEIIQKDIRPRIPISRPRIKPLKKKKTITQKTKKGGKYYKRTKPARFNKSEIAFLNTRQDKTGKEVYMDYIKIYGESRTKSSIVSKFYRVKKK